MASTTSNACGVQPDRATATLAQNWLLFTLRGLFAMIFGCLALAFPGPTMLSLALLFSAYMLIDGTVAIISAVRAIRRKGRWGFFILAGLLNIAAGIGAFFWPGLTVLAFVLLVAFWATVTGLSMTAAAFYLNIENGKPWLALAGLLSLAYGALLVYRPLVGAIVLTWWMGAYALAFGIALVIFSLRLRPRRWPTPIGTAR